MLNKPEKTHRSLSFNISASSREWRKLERMKPFPAAAMPLSASKDPQQWAPVENAMGLSLGILSPPKKQISRLLAEHETDGQIQGLIEICPDLDKGDLAGDGAIPQEGFLISEIFFNLVPFQRQITTLDKLIKGECVNPRLPDFILDPVKARIPDAPVLALDEADLAYLVNDLKFKKPNTEQELAIAKILKAPDLFALQGPPGTGKTYILAAATALLVKRGERVLISSQSNVAVYAILKELAGRPEILPLRIGRNGSDSPFSEENLIHTWYASIYSLCREKLSADQELAADHERMNQLWPHLAEIANQYQECLSRRTKTKRRAKRISNKIVKVTDDLNKHNRQRSVYSAAVGTLELAARQIEKNHSSADSADWVKHIAASDRTKIFNPLKTLQRDVSLSPTVRKLLFGPQPTGDNKRLASHFDQQHGQLPKKKTRPNYGIEWLYTNDLLNRLATLQVNLPQLLELCEEAERLCVLSDASTDAADDTWTKITGDLHGMLKASGQAVADVLEIDDIATALGSDKDFLPRLAQARSVLHEALATIPELASTLKSALITIAEAAMEYLNDRLTKTTQQIQRAESSLSALKIQQNEAAEISTEIEQEIKRLQANFGKDINALPAGLISRIADGPPPLSAGALAILNDGRDRYLQDTEDQLAHHQRWGAIQARWLKLIANSTKADNRISALYIKRCNVVGATCSWCGNNRDFLSREECGRFDTVIIDEISKVTLPELLTAVILGRRLILCGDYRQLPPTFKMGRRYERSYHELDEIGIDIEQLHRFEEMVTASFFKKLFEQLPEVLKQTCTKQYRSERQIMEVYNEFYDIPLVCAIEDPQTQCDHGLTIETSSGEFLTPKNHVIWADTPRDVKGAPVYEQQVGDGKANEIEAQSVIRLVKLINAAAGRAGKAPGSVAVGIITFYGAQVVLIRRLLEKLDPKAKRFLKIRLSSVDNFQGMEQELVILSMVRSKRGRIGDFAKKFERINVAMSRAQKLLVILGAVKTFANVEVSFPGPEGKTINKKSYRNILDIVKKYEGLRNLRDLL